MNQTLSQKLKIRCEQALETVVLIIIFLRLPGWAILQSNPALP